MHSSFSLEITVGQWAFNLEGYGFDTGFFTIQPVQNRYLVALVGGIAAVHPVQHHRPVHALSTAGTRM